jgi:uracil-DNA glycosylase family 4
MPVPEANNPTCKHLLKLKTMLPTKAQSLLQLQCGSTGPSTAKIAIVGEAPGELEAAKGTPFIGRAGMKLDELLASTENPIDREECYITNVIKERPYRNDITPFLDFRTVVTNESEAYKAYRALLALELNELPNDCIIIPMGKTALYALTGERSIFNWRGSIMESMKLLGHPARKIIPTIHPAAALRDPVLAYYIAHDLERVRDEQTVDGFQPPVRELATRPSFAQAKDYLNMWLTTPNVLLGATTIAFDIEVQNQEVCCISFSHDPNYAMTIAFSDRTDIYTAAEELELWELIKTMLEEPSLPKVAHNAYFDSTFLFEKYGIRCQNLHCSMVAHNLLNPDFKHSLAFLTSWYTREPYYKDQGKDIIDGLAWDATRFWEYCAKDSACCLEAWLIIKEHLKQIGNWETYLNQVAVIPQLTYMQVRGVRMDLTGITQAANDANTEIDKLQGKLRALLGEDLPDTFANSVKQLTAHFKKKGVKPYTNRKTGKPTFDDTAMTRLARNGHPEAILIQKMRKVKKMRGSYIKAEMDPDRRCRGSWNAAGTRSGRFSCQKLWRGGAKGKRREVGLPMQTLPKSFKRHFLADHGYILFDVDLSQAENRIVAWLAPEERMKRAFLSGQDVHALTASLLFGIPLEEVSDKEGSSPLAGGDHSQRHWGKMCNHALNYGLGYKKFSLRMEIPERDGKKLVEAYHAAYPAVREKFHKQVEQELKANHRMITNPYGRRRRFQNRIAGDSMEDAYAQIPQSTVADKIIRDGHLFMGSDPVFASVELLLNVHDSLVFQVPLSAGWQHISVILRSLVDSLEKPIHIGGEDLVIPAGVGMGLNMRDLTKVVSLEPGSVEAVYKEVQDGARKSESIQTVNSGTLS